MTNEVNKSLTPSRQDDGFFQALRSQLKLVLRLISDRRVNLLLKILPLATLIYLIVPDLFPGPVDDAVVIGLGLYTFVELCSEEVVEEHRSALGMSGPKSSKKKDGEQSGG